MSSSAVDISRTWNLTEIYPDLASWNAEREHLRSLVERLSTFRGRLGEGIDVVGDLLDLDYEISRVAEKLRCYAALLSDQDVRASEPQRMRQEIEAYFAEIAAAAAWVEPELLDLSTERFAALIDGAAEGGRLSDYRRYLERLETRRPHVLDARSEELLGHVQLIRGQGGTVSGLLHDSDIPWRTVSLSDGSDLRLDSSGYARGRNLPNRVDRKLVFETFHGQLRQYRNTLAAALYGTVKEHVLDAKIRSHGDALSASLFGNEVETSVYHMLLDEIDNALPTLHRYLGLRQRMLKLDDLHYHDMYVPIVESSDRIYSWESSRDDVLASAAPLGGDYVDGLRTALTSRWVDVDPRLGKRSGAYLSDGAYDVHPYMLLNHIDDYQSASTVAHEAGHLMHSWLSQKIQPYATSHYTIFVAEVASTLNEQLFFHHLLGAADSREEKLFLLGQHLQTIRATVYRQTLFAEFELQIHREVEGGAALTGDGLSDRYLELLRRYHGHDAGVMEIDDLYASEWAFIPHFHYDFYVYQYATSYVAATALVEQILADPGAVPRYLEFLSSGCAKPPVELLRDAGVDMTTPEPIRATIREMNRVIDEIEALLPSENASS